MRPSAAALEDQLLAVPERDLGADEQRLLGGLLDVQPPAALPAARRVAQDPTRGPADDARAVAGLTAVRRARDLAEIEGVGVALGGLPARQLTHRGGRVDPPP